VSRATRSVADTEALGAALGRVIDPRGVIALLGPLGAGKTAFVRGLARGLGCADRVTSPTFVYAHEYPGRRPLAHLDLYRLEPGAALDDLGLTDYLDGSWVVAVEWADRAAEQLPDDRIVVRFEAESDEVRRIEIEALGARSQAALARLETAAVESQRGS
jgi:tRNA threonylcarbamoyladenosine biosynthesis protein TsaE